MDNLNNYWQEYGTINDTASTTTNATSDSYIVSGYVCPHCGAWVSYGESHQCYYPYTYTYHYPPENKTEQAFKILNLLVEEKIIKEPSSFKKFCSLIEKLAGVI